jgi:predicted amidohydrolase
LTSNDIVSFAIDREKMKMEENNLKIATSQFAVTTNIKKNLGQIIKYTESAARNKCEIIHFPELALSGYETDIGTLNWELLQISVEKLQEIAKLNNINLVIGIHHKNDNGLKPYNATYLITSDGKVGGKYFKMKLYREEKDRFSTTENYFTYDIKQIKCGFLVCYDSSFPELFLKYRERGVKILFLSYYNAKSSEPKNSMDELMRSQLITRATDNIMYISGSNSSSNYSRMPSSFVCPDGTIYSMKRHKAGITIWDYPKKNLGWVNDVRK